MGAEPAMGRRLPHKVSKACAKALKRNGGASLLTMEGLVCGVGGSHSATG